MQWAQLVFHNNCHTSMTDCAGAKWHMLYFISLTSVPFLLSLHWEQNVGQLTGQKIILLLRETRVFVCRIHTTNEYTVETRHESNTFSFRKSIKKQTLILIIMRIRLSTTVIAQNTSGVFHPHNMNWSGKTALCSLTNIYKYQELNEDIKSSNQSWRRDGLFLE